MKNRTRTAVFLSDGDTREQVIALGVVTMIAILALFVTIADGGNFEKESGIISIAFFALAAAMMMPTGALFLFKLTLDIRDALKDDVPEKHH